MSNRIVQNRSEGESSCQERAGGEKDVARHIALPAPGSCVTKGYVPFWRNRSTAMVAAAASASQARSRAHRKQKKVYEAIAAARRANLKDTWLISRGVWVRWRWDGS